MKLPAASRPRNRDRRICWDSFKVYPLPLFVTPASVPEDSVLLLSADLKRAVFTCASTVIGPDFETP